MTKRDKNAPKRPCSAYICFTNAKRDAVVKANPTMAHTDVTRRLGEMWKAEQNRKPYEALAAKDKARYEKEKAAYVPPPDAQPSKCKRDPNAPMRPKSAYLFFSADKRKVIVKENPSLAAKDTMKRLAEAWNKATPKTKAKYEAMAAKDKERYEKERAAYVPTRDASPKRTKKDPAAPKRPKNAFLYFSGAERLKVKAALGDAATIGTISQELGKRWKAMSDEQKRPFTDQAAAAKQAVVTV